MLNLHGKTALILGVASEHSIAWAVAKTLHQAGASIYLGYQQCFKSRILQLVRAGEIPISLYERCDITTPGDLDALIEKIPGNIDIVIHSVAYANPETFRKPIWEVTADEFTASMLPSAHSLLSVARAVKPRMTQGGSIITMTYLGGQRVVAHYKLMGIAKAALEATVRVAAAELGTFNIRINAISAGPLRTLAASQVSDFDSMLKTYEAVSPMRRIITQQDVANLATFLASDLSSNITGQTMFVDAGYNILAMAALEKPQS